MHPGEWRVKWSEQERDIELINFYRPEGTRTGGALCIMVVCDLQGSLFDAQRGVAAGLILGVSHIEPRVSLLQQRLFRRFDQLQNSCCYGIAGAICVGGVEMQLPDRADALAV